jgi:hypothetical protein
MNKFTFLFCLVLLIVVNSCQSNSDTEIDKNKSDIQDARTKALQDKYVSTDPEKNSLQKQFDAVLLKFDSLTVYNEKISDRSTEAISKLTKTKAEVNRILLRDKLTPEEKQEAKKLINEMNNTLNVINK